MSPIRVILSLGVSDEQLSCTFPDSETCLFVSGKSAIAFALKNLLNPSQGSVAVSAYTCPDVLAAIDAAGFKARLIDVDPNTTRISIDTSKLKGCCAVILSNLFGIPDVIQEDLGDILVIDDRCQAAFHSLERENSVSVFSFGRGKGFCGMGGGLLVIPHSVGDKYPDLSKRYNSIDTESEISGCLRFIKLFCARILERPALYYWVKRIPFLSIGETQYPKSIERSRPSCLSKKMILTAVRMRSKRKLMLLEKSTLYEEIPSEDYENANVFKIESNGEALVRVPFLCVDEQERDELCRIGADLGFQKPYPELLTYYFNSDQSGSEYPNAESLKNRLLTLPISPFVNKRSIKRCLQIFSEY